MSRPHICGTFPTFSKRCLNCSAGDACTMRTIATFIGIDRHAAPDVRDLAGARRDAIALRCLFADSVPNVRARTLCDEDATVSAVREAIAETLGNAEPDDTVVFSFSGHGTP